MRSRLYIAAVFCGIVLNGMGQAIAQSGEDQGINSNAEEWIVMGTDAAQALTNDLASKFIDVNDAPLFAINTEENGRTIARIEPNLTPFLHETMHEKFNRCGGYTVHESREAALSELNNPVYQSDFTHAVGIFNEPLDQAIPVNRALGLVQPSTIISTIRQMENLGTRHYQTSGGQEAAIRVQALWNGYGAGRGDFSVERIGHSWLQDSVVATIRGSEKPNEIVVIGGHLDSMNANDHNDAPGADDNGSGIAVVSEVLRVLTQMNFRPKRTIQFMAYAAEEVGLRGSGDIAARYRRENRNVVGVLQFDMTGFRGSNRDMYFVTDNVNPNATNFLRRLIRTYNANGAHRITYADTQCGYACSDHASWNRHQFPAAFPFESAFSEYNRAIHSPRDRVSVMDSTGAHQTRFAKLGLEFVIELAKSSGGNRPTPTSNRYLQTSLKVITNGAPRGCKSGEWACMTRLCKADMRDASAWRGWAGCWKSGSKFQCYFECGKISTLH